MNTTTNLIPVFTAIVADEPVQLCNARELHSTLQVGRDFSNWIKDRIDTFGFIEGEDFILCSPNPASKKGRGGHNRTDYHLTLDMAKELAMVENNEIGREIRRYLIRLEKKAIAAGLKVDAVITRAQLGELSCLLAERFPVGKDRPYAWSRFNNHFRLASYKDLPAAKFSEACEYIQQMPTKAGPTALPSEDFCTLNQTVQKWADLVETGNGVPAEVFEPIARAVLKKKPNLGNDPLELTDETLTALATKKLQSTRFITYLADSDYHGSPITPFMIPIAKGAQVLKPEEVIDEIATNRMKFFSDDMVKDLLWAISCRVNPARLLQAA